MIANGIGQTRDSFESIYAKTEATGLSPITFKGHNAPVQYEIAGNMIQEGTPTPTNPIYPDECGDKTENLFDGNYINAYIDVEQYKFVNSGTDAKSAVIEVEPDTTYTVKKCDTSNRFLVGSAARVPTNQMALSMINTDNEETEVTFTTEGSTRYIVVYVSTGAEQATPRLMFKKGSTALTYEPYGMYKLPLDLNNGVQNLFLSEPIRKIGNYSDAAKSDNSAVRKLRKLVLTGDDNFGRQNISSADPSFARFSKIFQFASITSTTAILYASTHFPGLKSFGTSNSTSENCFEMRFSSGTTTLMIVTNAATDATSFNRWLADQYAAGTPVTIWYVLADETTETITSPTLTASAGQNTLSVNTTLAPSNIHVHGEYEIAEIYSGLDYANLIYLKSQTMTGSTPLAFESYPGGLRDYQIFGNTHQNGVPTPSDPVDVQGVGEKTAQLIPEIVQGGVSTIDGFLSDSSNRVRTNYISVESGKTYAVSSGNQYLATGCYYNNGVFSRKIDEVVSLATSVTFTVPENVNQIAIGFRKADGETSITPSDLQSYILNEGSTSLLYEPYGWKIPLTVNGTEYPIYLGQVRSTRIISKIIITGSETNIVMPKTSSFQFQGMSNLTISTDFYCTHYANIGWGSIETVTGAAFRPPNGDRFRICDLRFSSVNEFKNYLVQQYQKGTPVTVFFVDTVARTRIENNLLMKIGNYADELHSTDAGVTIPTNAGTNTLTVDTTVQPSSVSITGHLKPSSIYGNLTDVDGVYIKDKDGLQIKVTG